MLQFLIGIVVKRQYKIILICVAVTATPKHVRLNISSNEVRSRISKYE